MATVAAAGKVLDPRLIEQRPRQQRHGNDLAPFVSLHRDVIGIEFKWVDEDPTLRAVDLSRVVPWFGCHDGGMQAAADPGR